MKSREPGILLWGQVLLEQSHGKGRQAEIPTTRDDPAIGRWGSVDPMGPTFPDQTAYQYVHNNPPNRYDPDGNADFGSAK